MTEVLTLFDVGSWLQFLLVLWLLFFTAAWGWRAGSGGRRGAKDD